MGIGKGSGIVGGGVLLLGVFRVHRPQSRIDTTGGQCGVRVILAPFANGENINAVLAELNRGSEPCTPVPITSTDVAVTRSITSCTPNHQAVRRQGR